MNKFIESHLSKGGNTLLYRFAYVGKKEEYLIYLKELAELAEPEIWNSDPSIETYDILNNYIIYTFDKALKDDLVVLTKDNEYAAFNTGLLTKN